MVTFHGIGSNDRHLLGVGLSEENLRRLREGKPIMRPLDHMGKKFAGIDLLICWGKNEDAITAKLVEMGMLDPADVRDERAG